MRYVFIVIVFISSSCSLLNGFKKRKFTTGNEKGFQLLVPKGWKDVITTADSNGKQVQVFNYENGASFYISNTGKPINKNELIDTVQHIALPHAGGGRAYKGVLPPFLYWREIQKDAFRFGYKNVQPGLENRFDSALNYSALMRGVR